MIREGPDKCILTHMTFVWCFTRGEPVRLKPVCTQLVAAKDKNPSQIFDVVADHFQDLDRRLFVTTPDSSLKKGTSEFATLCVDNDKTELKAKGRFALSSARKSRMFRAHLAQSPVSELLIDRRVLTAYYENQPYDENRPVLSYISNMEDSTRTNVMGMLKSEIASKRRRAPKKTQTPRKLAKGVGIAKKTPITDVFANFLESACDLKIDRNGKQALVARTEIVKALPAYIKAKNLNQGRVVNYKNDPDGLGSLMPENFDSEITFFSLYKHINHHFNPEKKDN